MIDYRSLLFRYMQWIKILEGTTFVYSIDRKSKDFSKEELEELRKIHLEVKDLDLRPPEHR